MRKSRLPTSYFLLAFLFLLATGNWQLATAQQTQSAPAIQTIPWNAQSPMLRITPSTAQAANVLEIYTNVQVATPAAVTFSNGGAGVKSNYYAQAVWVDAAGRQTLPGPEADYLGHGDRAVIHPPAAATGAAGWLPYVSNKNGGEVLQGLAGNCTTVSAGSVTACAPAATWTTPAGGLRLAGTAPPTLNTAFRIGCAIAAAGPLTCPGGGGSGTVTSVGLAGTANEITVTGASPIIGSGSWTLSFPSAGVNFPGPVTFAPSTITTPSITIPSGSSATLSTSGDMENVSGVLKFCDGNLNPDTIPMIHVWPSAGHLAAFSATPGLLEDGGTAGTGTVTESGSTLGYIPLWGTVPNLTNSHLDDGVTTAATITSTEPVYSTGTVTADGGFIGPSLTTNGAGPLTITSGGYPADSSYTAGLLGCPTSSGKIGNCASGVNPPVVGVLVAADGGGGAHWVVTGIATVTFNSGTAVTHGDFICVDAVHAGLVTDNSSTPCTTEQVGMVISDAGSATTQVIYVQLR